MRIILKVIADTDDLEIARINEGRKRQGQTLHDAETLVYEAVVNGLMQKFVHNVEVIVDTSK